MTSQRSTAVLMLTVIAALLVLMLPLKFAGPSNLRSTQDYKACSLGFHAPGLLNANPEITPTPADLFSLFEAPNRTDPDAVAIQCWFTNIELVYNKAECRALFRCGADTRKSPLTTG